MTYIHVCNNALWVRLHSLGAVLLSLKESPHSLLVRDVITSSSSTLDLLNTAGISNEFEIIAKTIFPKKQ